MIKEQAVAHKLLVAMPDQAGGFFEKSVILMLEHNKQGAMGLTLTHPSENSVHDVLRNLALPIQDHLNLEQHVMVGGPVQADRGFILHNKATRWENTVALSDQLSMTVSLDFLRAIGEDAIDEDYQIFLGYAGWGAGQLEEELKNNVWLFAEADPHLLFETAPDLRWQAAFNSIGINTNRLSRVVGHA